MRRFLSAESLVPHRAERELSVEEEMIEQTETITLAQDAKDELQEAERALGVSEALENLVDVAETIQGEPTPAEAAMAEIVGDAAVAGSADVESTDVVPATESAGGRRHIAVEGIKEVIASIWAAIKAAVKSFWETIKKWWNKFFGQIPSIRRRLKALRERVEATSGQKKKDGANTFSVSTGIESLSVNYTPTKDGASLVKGLESLFAVVNDVTSKASKETSDAGEAIVEIISETDASNAQAKATDLVAKLAAAFKAGRLSSVSNKAAVAGYSDFETYVSEQILGNYRLMCKQPRAKDGEDRLLGGLEKFRRSGYVVIEPRDTKTSPALATEIDFKTMEYGVMLDAISACEKIIDRLEAYETSKEKKEIEKVSDKLKNVCDKAAANFEKVRGDEDAKNGNQLPYFKAMLNFNLAYASWTRTPMTEVFTKSLATVRATMNVVEKSAKQYS